MRTLIILAILLSAPAVGSLAAQESAVVEIPVAEAAAGDSFHKNVIRAAIKSQKAGKLSRKDLLKLRVAMLSPAFRVHARDLSEVQMYSSGDSAKIPRVDGKIDWDKLFDFIDKLIPLIIQLIDAIKSI